MSFGNFKLDPTPEPEYGEELKIWQRNPNPRNTTKLLNRAQPTIDKAISAHVGAPNPMLRSRAKQLTIQAFQTYDPNKGAKMSTHIMNQLQGLKRYARQQNQIAIVPERTSLDHGRLTGAENDLLNDLGRPPSDGELADRTGLSLARITKLRQLKGPVAEGTLLAKVDEDNEPYEPGVVQPSSQGWVDLVYSDLDPINQKIMEWTLGLHGQKALPNMEIAKRLRMSPGAVSQRKKLVQGLLDQQQTLSPF